jgi:cohesin complex subunit SA-1/2
VPKVKKARKGAKSGAAAVSSAEESEGEKTIDEDEAAPRPKPKRTTRANPVVEEATALDEGNNPDPVTPKPRPRPRPLHRDKTPTGSLHGSENGRNSLSGSPPPPVGPSDEELGLGGEPNNEIATPTSSLKRPRMDEVDETIEVPNGTSEPDHLINVDGTLDLQVRRKRIRH